MRALTGLAFVAPFDFRIHPFGWLGFDVPILTFVVGISCVMLVAQEVRRPERCLTRLDMIVAFWIAVLWLSAVVSANPSVGAIWATHLTMMVALVPLVAGIVTDRQQAQRLLEAIGLGVIAAVMVGLTFWVLGDLADGQRGFGGSVTRVGPFNRLTRPWGHANNAAMSIGASIAAVALLRSRVVAVIALPLVVVAGVLTISRGGLMGLTAAAVIWLVVRRRRGEVVFAAGLAAIAVVTFVLSSAWDARVDQVGDTAFFGSEVKAPASLTIGGADGPPVPLSIGVSNTSITSWETAFDAPVELSARWMDEHRDIWAEDRWELPSSVGPGESVSVEVPLTASVPVGNWQIRWDLLIDGVAYFGQFLGDEPVQTAVVVESSAVSAADLEPTPLVQRFVNMGRWEGWQVGWDQFIGSPILGVGPNQFSRSVEVEYRIQGVAVMRHAHNIILQPLTAWGVLGALPFFFVGARSFFGSAVAGWRGRHGEAAAVVAGLGALAIHGLVDWPLVTLTTGSVMMMLIGLGWSGALRASPD